jgi:integrase
MSAAEAKRLMKAEANRLESMGRAAPPLDEARERVLASYGPRSMSEARWAAASPFIRDVMRRSNITGIRTFPQLLSELTLFVDWALEAGADMTIEGVLRHDLIERWVAEQGEPESTTWGNRRSRLRNLASTVNPGIHAPRRPAPFGRASLKAPYTLREMADLERLALNQPSKATRRNLCAMVGLGAGAGLSSTDLRGLRRSHLAKDERGVWWVDVPGERARRVPVRQRFDHLIEEAVKGLKPDDLVIGIKEGRKNITSTAVTNAAIGDTNVTPEQARLRATWLLAVISMPVPIADVMAAAGTTSARNIVDLAPYASDTAYVTRTNGGTDVHAQ